MVLRLGALHDRHELDWTCSEYQDKPWAVLPRTDEWLDQETYRATGELSVTFDLWQASSQRL